MKVNDVIELKILRLGDNGEGIAEHENIIVFVPFALVSEIVKVKIEHIKKRYAFAKLLKVLEKSPERVEPMCKCFGVCGGCDIQHMNYNNQLSLKQDILKDCLRKFSGQVLDVEKTIKSDNQFEYRNKIQLPIGFKNNKIVVGFYKKGSHEIVPIENCPLHGKWANELIGIVKVWANKFGITAYNEKSHKGLLRHIVARFVDKHLSVTLVINGEKIPKIDELQKMLEKSFKNYSLFFCVNKKKTNVILTDDIKTIVAPKDLINVNGIKCEISPLSFFQINDNVRQKLYNAVVNAVGKNDIIIDAYSGIGFMTNYLAKNCSQVYGIEIIKDAVENADILAKNNGNFDKITNIYGDTAIILPQLVKFLKENKDKNFINSYFKNENTNEDLHICKCNSNNFDNKKVENQSELEHTCNCGNNCSCKNKENSTKSQFKTPIRADKVAIVLDPPRKGCDLSVIQSVIESKADTVVYVSCNPTTLARDLKYLLPYYTPTKITPFDMFPNTSHLETLCCLSRKS